MKEHIERICNDHNTRFPDKGRLCITPNTLSETVNVVLGTVPLIEGVSLQNAFYVVAAIRNYAEANKEVF